VQKEENFPFIALFSCIKVIIEQVSAIINLFTIISCTMDVKIIGR